MSLQVIRKGITHLIAIALTGAITFAVSPAGQAIVHQYPVLSGVFGILGALGALYHSPETAVPHC